MDAAALGGLCSCGRDQVLATDDRVPQGRSQQSDWQRAVQAIPGTDLGEGHIGKQGVNRLVGNNRFPIRIAVVEPKPVFCGKRIWNNLFEFLRFSRESLLFKMEAHMVEIIEE